MRTPYASGTHLGFLPGRDEQGIARRRENRLRPAAPGCGRWRWSPWKSRALLATLPTPVYDPQTLPLDSTGQDLTRDLSVLTGQGGGV